MICFSLLAFLSFWISILIRTLFSSSDLCIYRNESPTRIIWTCFDKNMIIVCKLITNKGNSFKSTGHGRCIGISVEVRSSKFAWTEKNKRFAVASKKIYKYNNLSATEIRSCILFFFVIVVIFFIGHFIPWCFFFH